MYLGGYIWYRHIARFGMECISAGISCISAPLSHASLHLPALHAAPPYTSSSKAAPSSSSTPTSINFFQPLPDTFLSGKARRSLDRNCFSISNFLQGSARASLDLPRWILWSRSGFAHWRQLPTITVHWWLIQIWNDICHLFATRPQHWLPFWDKLPFKAVANLPCPSLTPHSLAKFWKNFIMVMLSQ